MFNFFKKTVTTNANDFENQYKIAKIIIFKYLDIWFKQIFSTSEYKDLFADKSNMHTTMAAEVMRNLLVLDDTRNADELKNNEEVIMAKKYSNKWSDDAMNRDNNFCNFIVQTLRMDAIFNQFFNGTEWIFENPRGKRVFEVVKKYGKNVTESPSPEKYEKLIQKWMQWDKKIEKKLNKQNF